MKKLLILTLLVSFVTLGAFWMGKKTCGMMCSMGTQTQKAWYADLGLAAAQERSLRGSEASFRQKADSLCMQVCREKQNLLDSLADPNVDPKAVYQKIEQIGNLQTSLEKEVVVHIFNVQALLTPAQRKTYHDRIQRQFQKALAQSGYTSQCAMAKR